MKTRAMLLSAAVATLMALPALAQNAAAPPPAGAAPPTQNDGSGAAPMHGHNGGGMGGMGPMDTNHDGVLSKDEWMAVFNRMDLNHDGKVSRDEMHAMQQVRMGKMNAMKLQGQGAPGGPPPGAPDQAPAAGQDQPPPRDGSDQ